MGKQRRFSYAKFFSVVGALAALVLGAWQVRLNVISNRLAKHLAERDSAYRATEQQRTSQSTVVLDAPQAPVIANANADSVKSNNAAPIRVAPRRLPDISARERQALASVLDADLHLALQGIESQSRGNDWVASPAVTQPFWHFVSRSTEDPRYSRVGADVAARLLRQAIEDYEALRDQYSTLDTQQLWVIANAVGLRRQITLLNEALKRVDQSVAYRGLAGHADALLVD